MDSPLDRAVRSQRRWAGHRAGRWSERISTACSACSYTTLCVGGSKRSFSLVIPPVATTNGGGAHSGHWSTSGFSYWALARSLWQPEQFNRTVALKYWAEKAFGGVGQASAAAAGVDYINFWEAWTNRTFTNATVRAHYMILIL